MMIEVKTISGETIMLPLQLCALKEVKTEEKYITIAYLYDEEFMLDCTLNDIKKWITDALRGSIQPPHKLPLEFKR